MFSSTSTVNKDVYYRAYDDRALTRVVMLFRRRLRTYNKQQVRRQLLLVAGSIALAVPTSLRPRELGSFRCRRTVNNNPGHAQPSCRYLPVTVACRLVHST